MHRAHDDECLTTATRTATDGSELRVKMELERGTCVGRFVVLEELGSGGMGVVYSAYDPTLDRQIAIKLLRIRNHLDGSRERLMREAQALAQLSHPNVVAVFDVGEYDDMLFLAMELVRGETLRTWLGRETRSRSEILRHFLDAGRGLATAHRAGIIHRDFKPDNVVLGDDGRARVLDFGLARANDTPELPVLRTGAPDPTGETSGERLLSSDLTQDGSVMGTPVYMAPEQTAAERTDARTDQFSFCVALYQALYGEHPFGGGRLGADVDWQVQPLSSPSDVPGWLRDVLLRGLSKEPVDRFDSMDELLAALENDPTVRARSRRRLVAWVAASLVLGAGAFATVQTLVPDAPACGDSRSLLTNIWDDARRTAIGERFAATGSTFATQTWTPVQKVVDRYADDWVAMRNDTCRATRERSEQSEAVMDMRMLCLTRLHAELDALTDVFAEADATVVERAVAAAHSLSPVAECADETRLRPHGAPPRDQDAVENARAVVARAKALHSTGRYEQGLEVASDALERARATGYGPVEAEALRWRGRLEEGLADYDKAEATLRKAMAVAERSGYDELRAALLSRLVYVVGYRRANYDAALRLADMAHAVYDRVGGHELERATLISNVGTVHFATSKLEKAIEHDSESLAIRERRLGGDHPDIASSLNNIGILYCDLGQFERAIEPLSRALAMRRRIFGDEHPVVAMAHNNLGLAQHKLGRHDEARQSYQRGLAIRERALGPDNPKLAFSHEGLGVVALASHDPATALVHYRRAYELRVSALGEDHPDIAYALDGIGNATMANGDAAEAAAIYRRSLGIFESNFGKDNVDYALTQANLAAAEAELGRKAAALDNYKAAAAVIERHAGADNPELARIFFEMWAIERALGDDREAVALLDRAATICSAQRCSQELADALHIGHEPAKSP